MNTKKGFTLIELLVVIAIIGILSAVILASLSTARAKAANANVKSTLSSIRSQAELYFQDNSSYGTSAFSCTGPGSCTGTGICAPTSQVVKMLCNAAVTGGGVADSAGLCSGHTAGPTPPGSQNDVYCYASGSKYTIYSRLKTPENNSTNYAWCVDSNGKSKPEPSIPAYSAGTLDCP